MGNVSSGEDAIRTSEQERPELVLMDVRLGGEMDGIQAAEIIRDRFNVPVVYLTAYADEETILRARETTPFGYLVKPFNERELRATIEIAFYTHQMERTLADERAKRQAAEEFKILIDGVRDYAIFMLDESGRVTTWNSGAERLKGYTRDEIIGRDFSIFYTEEARQAGHSKRWLEIALRDGRYEEENWRVRKDGTRFWASVIITAIRDESGALIGFAKVTRDLTEGRLAEEKRERLIDQLQKALEARDEFLQVASHELKTPLTTLRFLLDSLVRVLEKAGGQIPQVSSMLESATRQVGRLTALVNSLLDVSRITAGRLDLQLEEFNFFDMVRGVVERFQEEAQRAGGAITVHGDTKVAGRWDPLRVEQIVSNLLSNAVKYGEHKPIDVEVREDDRMVRLVVTDRGIGIERDALSRIFDRFERAVSMRHFGGLGLGLFISRQIAEAHGGTIMAQSQRGSGSTFTVILPRRPGMRPTVDGPLEAARH